MNNSLSNENILLLSITVPRKLDADWEFFLQWNVKCLIVLSQNTSQLQLINKLANTIEKSVILHFVHGNSSESVKDFEFDRPAIWFNSDSNKVKI